MLHCESRGLYNGHACAYASRLKIISVHSLRRKKPLMLAVRKNTSPQSMKRAAKEGQRFPSLCYPLGKKKPLTLIARQIPAHKARDAQPWMVRGFHSLGTRKTSDPCRAPNTNPQSTRRTAKEGQRFSRPRRIGPYIILMRVLETRPRKSSLTRCLLKPGSDLVEESTGGKGGELQRPVAIGSQDSQTTNAIELSTCNC